MRTGTKVVLVALCVALAISAAGCGKKKHVVAAVAADTSVSGVVTVYTSLPKAQADGYLALFQAEYPNVKLTVVNDTPTAIADKLVKEKSAPVADVVWHTPISSVERAAEASALAPYAYHPGQLDSIQADYIDGDNPDNPLWVGTDAQMIGWDVNASKTGGASPATFSDLIDPKYSGQIVMPSVNTDAGYALVSNILVNMSETEGWAYLDQLNKNVAYYTSDQAAPAKDAASGAAGVGISFDAPVAAAQSGGSAATAVFPGLPEMSPWEVDADSLVNKPAPSAAAKSFLDWAISDAAMAAYSKDTPITSVDMGNDLPAGYPAAVSDQLMQPNDFSWTADNHAKVVAEWTKRYGSKIKQ